jgi:protein-S-isoprenylcysteine O-methyltransferase Ste14
MVVVKKLATGSILDRPKGNLLVQLVNGFNLFFLLIVNPLAAISLITSRLEMIDPARIIIDDPWLIQVWEMAGLVVYVMGYLLMAWALIRLKQNYQIGGSTPRPKDEIVMNGPYRLVRHPMYTAALCNFPGASQLDSIMGFIRSVRLISYVDSLTDSFGRRWVETNL